MLQNKKILLCLSGGIAVYKCVELASSLVKEGAIVKTIMTKAAMEFVTPLTFKSITKETVSHKLFNPDSQIEHISLSDWADIIVIVPATANVIGKIANGIADDLLTTTVMAANCPKLIVPAMNVKMYENPILQDNLNKLINYGFNIMEPETGYLACGYQGKGRMPDVIEIIYAIKTYLYYKKDLIGKSVLITAGASIEKIDPMRYITNVSTGKMGIELARTAYFRGANVILVHSALKEKIPYYMTSIEANSAAMMYETVMNLASKMDLIIMTAAVADYTPKTVYPEKMKKSNDISLDLIRTADILNQLGRTKKETQYFIGFAAETENLLTNAKEKLQKKNLNMIVANEIKYAAQKETEIYIIKRTDLENCKKYKDDKFIISQKILDEYLND